MAIELRSAQAMIWKGRDLAASGKYIPCLPVNGSIVPCKIRAWEIHPQIAFHVIFAAPDIYKMQKGETLAFVIERPSFNTKCRGYKSISSAASSIALAREDDLGPSLIRLFIEGKEPLPLLAHIRSKF